MGLFHVPKARRVLVLQQELGDEAFQERLRIASVGYPNLSLDNLYIYPCFGLKFDTAAGQAILKTLFRELRPEVVIFDPLYKFWCIADEDKAAQIQRREDILDEFIVDFSLSVIITHHLKKPHRDGTGKYIRQESSMELRGSSQLTAWADTIMVMTPIEKDKIMASFDMRHAPDEPPVLILNRDRAHMRFVAEIQGQPTGVNENNVILALQTNKGHMAYNDLVMALTTVQGGKRTWQRALTGLKSKGLISYTGTGPTPRTVWLLNPRTIGWHLFD